MSGKVCFNLLCLNYIMIQFHCRLIVCVVMRSEGESKAKN